MIAYPIFRAEIHLQCIGIKLAVETKTKLTNLVSLSIALLAIISGSMLYLFE